MAPRPPARSAPVCVLQPRWAPASPSRLGQGHFPAGWRVDRAAAIASRTAPWGRGPLCPTGGARGLRLPGGGGGASHLERSQCPPARPRPCGGPPAPRPPPRPPRPGRRKQLVPRAGQRGPAAGLASEPRRPGPDFQGLPLCGTSRAPGRQWPRAPAVRWLPS